MSFKIRIRGKTYFTTDDENTFNHIKGSVEAYVDRYGVEGVEDYIEMIKEEI